MVQMRTVTWVGGGERDGRGRCPPLDRSRGGSDCRMVRRRGGRYGRRRYTLDGSGGGRGLGGEVLELGGVKLEGEVGDLLLEDGILEVRSLKLGLRGCQSFFKEEDCPLEALELEGERVEGLLGRARREVG